MARAGRFYQKLPLVQHFSVIKVPIFLVLFALVGTFLVFATHAATPVNNSIEPELGIINNGAFSFGDTNASGGSYVGFAAAAQICPAGQTGTPPNCVGNGTISNACQYRQVITAAFCATFDNAYTGSKTQTGDLDPVLWGVSRVNYTITPSHNACAGGGTTGNPVSGDPTSTYYGPTTPPPGDSRICNGQFVESLNDGGGVADIDTYPKQPFDFTGRTGHVVFDVSNDGTGSHGAWPEFIITDEPVPGTRSCSSQCGGTINIGTTLANNMVGFSMAGITISLSAGSSTSPVTSVVRK